MKTTQGLWLALVLLAFKPEGLEAAFSSSEAGTAGAQFLSLGVGARALGMGEAMSSVPDGLVSLYWNPAGLTSLTGSHLMLTHTQLFSDFYHDFMAYGQPMKRLNGVGAIGLTLLNQSEITAVTNTGQSLPGTFNPYSAALSIGYARSWGALSAGLALKGIQESLYDSKAQAAAMDAGVLYRPAQRPGLGLGLAFRHLGTKEKFVSQSFSLPFEINAGASHVFGYESGRRLLMATDLALPYYGRAHGKFGAEYAAPVREGLSLAFRGGYKTLPLDDLGPLSGLTVGLGLSLRRFTMDFGFEPMQHLGQIYRFSLGYGF